MTRRREAMQLLRFCQLERLLQVAAGFVERSLRIVVGLNSLAVFVGGALALSSNIENLAQLNVAPDFRPSRLAVAVETFPIGIGGRLIVLLLEEDFGDAVMRKRADFVGFEGFVVLG